VVSHSSNYGVGLQVLTGSRINSAQVKKEVEMGARIVFRDWEYHGGVVSFTGAHIAEILFGDKTLQSRRKALEIQTAYFRRFPSIRRWQKSVSQMAEKGWVQSASGRRLDLFGGPEEKLKQALAFFGQGCSADYIQESMLLYWAQGYVPLIQVHDELVFEIPRGMSDAQAYEFMQQMSSPSKFFPGFFCPVKISRGDNWLDMQEVACPGA